MLCCRLEKPVFRFQSQKTKNLNLLSFSVCMFLKCYYWQRKMQMPLQSRHKNIFENDQIHQKVEKNVFQVCCQKKLYKPHKCELILKAQSAIVKLGSRTY